MCIKTHAVSTRPFFVALQPGIEASKIARLMRQPTLTTIKVAVLQLVQHPKAITLPLDKVIHYRHRPVWMFLKEIILYHKMYTYVMANLHY